MGLLKAKLSHGVNLFMSTPDEGLGYPRFDSRLQQLLVLPFVACSTRQVEVMSDGEPSQGKTIEVP